MEKRLGLVGLGKMGKNIAINLLSKGYSLVVYNRSEGPAIELSSKGASVARSLGELVSSLERPRTVWLMLPAEEPTDNAISSLSSMLDSGDAIIDGSNSNYADSVRRAESLRPKGIAYLDAGCSGGPSGALNGMCIMVGGSSEAYAKNKRLFEDLSVPGGAMHTGPTGSGHFVKMVHNAIEYGMMQSIAEGAELLGRGPYEGLELEKIFPLWQKGSVIRGYLTELAGRALLKDPSLNSVSPYVEDNGEGRWAAKIALDSGIPLTSLAHSVFERFSSRDERRFGLRLLAALRHEFGGHEIKTG